MYAGFAGFPTNISEVTLGSWHSYVISRCPRNLSIRGHNIVRTSHVDTTLQQQLFTG
jgi:hypothetical protein